MPLDHYKTQVLLLHSEQSMLDTLSSGFGERYTVHCATSGSEALNTLVDTPINVIITVQDLPGMSGLEALREAKKRSPQTIGILLVGNANQGLEALVGDEEVFEVVRGNVTGDSLKKLVDNATQQMRLMALAESANDIAANVDEPAEHIIMETSENGATIISDGTGRMPILDPKKISARSSVGSQSIDVLVLTKDEEFLATIKKSARGMHNVHYANTLRQADETIRKHKVGVAVVDAAMVREKIERLTQYLRKGSPRLVSIVAGRRDDGEMLMDLINRGKVYRFLLKPVSPGRARLAVEASVKHHLEAPDAAFKAKGAPPIARMPAKPLLKPTPEPLSNAEPGAGAEPEVKTEPEIRLEPKVETEPASRTRVTAVPKAKAATVARSSKSAVPPDPVTLPPVKPTSAYPLDEALSDTFGDRVLKFATAMTGLLSVFGKSGKKQGKAGHAPATRQFWNLGSLIPRLRSIEPRFKKYIIPGVAAVAVIVAGGLFWFMGDGGDTPSVEQPASATPSITEASVDFGASSRSEVDIRALVDEARLARDAGQIFIPAGANAIELYADAVDADPADTALAAEFDAVIDQALSLAETALLETRLDEADAALQRVGLADAANARLPFLTAQLSQLRLRSYLDDARAAIRDTRFEDAGNALAAAHALGVAETAEIEAVTEELSTARSAQRVDAVLALANARLEEGDLLRPANDNARYYYDLVLSTDPGNTAASQGLNVVANKLVLQARSEIDAGNLNRAEAILADARAIDAASGELDAMVVALASAREAIVAQQRATEERLRAEAERRASEEQAAEKSATEEADAKAAEKTDAEDTTAEPPAASGTEDQLTAQEQAPPDTRDVAPVSISTLVRTRYVAPKYPRAAQRRNQSGWVDVIFTVSMDGSVKDLEVRNSEPQDVFDTAALRAVEKWEFDPIFEDGVIVEKRAGVRMMFALE